jgi:hypothetical protein
VWHRANVDVLVKWTYHRPYEPCSQRFGLERLPLELFLHGDGQHSTAAHDNPNILVKDTSTSTRETTRIRCWQHVQLGAAHMY